MNENKAVREIKHMQGWTIQNKIYSIYLVNKQSEFFTSFWF